MNSAGDPLEERRLGQRAGGRQEAEDRPLDAVGERRRRRPRGRRGSAEPPAAGLDLGQAPLGRPASSSRMSASSALDRVRAAPSARAPGRRARRRDAAPAGAIGSDRPGVRAASPAGRRRRRIAAVGRRRSASAGPASRRLAAGVRSVAGRGRERDEPAELAGPVEPDEDLAEQPLEAGRLAAGLQASRPRPRSRSGRRRPPRTAAGRTAPAARTGRAPGTRSGSPAPPGTGSSATLARVRGAGRQAPRRAAASSTTPADLVVAVGQPRAERGGSRPPTPPSAAATSASGPPSTRWIDPAVAGHRRLDRGERARRAPPPASPTAARIDGAGQGVERQQRRPPREPSAQAVAW